jgi:hypothetical protein
VEEIRERKGEAMTLIELLKQLAEKYPEKWSWNGFNESLYMVDHLYDGPRLHIHEYFTEDCDRILAEHGLVMTVDCGLQKCGKSIRWWGEFIVGLYEFTQVVPYDLGIVFPTKRAATEATFQAALEYILKEVK